MHETETLDGPDFLDALADAESANGNEINAAEFRRRARHWREDRQTLCLAAHQVADLQGRLNAVGRQIAA